MARARFVKVVVSVLAAGALFGCQSTHSELRAQAGPRRSPIASDAYGAALLIESQELQLAEQSTDVSTTAAAPATR